MLCSTFVLLFISLLYKAIFLKFCLWEVWTIKGGFVLFPLFERTVFDYFLFIKYVSIVNIWKTKSIVFWVNQSLFYVNWLVYVWLHSDLGRIQKGPALRIHHWGCNFTWLKPAQLLSPTNYNSMCLSCLQVAWDEGALV